MSRVPFVCRIETPDPLKRVSPPLFPLIIKHDQSVNGCGRRSGSARVSPLRQACRRRIGDREFNSRTATSRDMERVDVAIVGGGRPDPPQRTRPRPTAPTRSCSKRGSPCRPRPARSGFDRCRWHPRLLGRHHGDPPRRVRRRDRPARAEPRGVPRSGRVGDAHKHRNRLLVRQVRLHLPPRPLRRLAPRPR